MLLSYDPGSFRELKMTLDRLQDAVTSGQQSEASFFLELSALQKLHCSPTNLRSRRGNSYVEIIRRLVRLAKQHSPVLRVSEMLQRMIFARIEVHFCGVDMRLSLENLHRFQRKCLFSAWLLAKLHRICCRGGSDLFQHLASRNAGEFTSTFTLRLAAVSRYSVCCRDMLVGLQSVYQLSSDLKRFLPTEAALNLESEMGMDDDSDSEDDSDSRRSGPVSVCAWNQALMQEDSAVPFRLPNSLDEYIDFGPFVGVFSIFTIFLTIIRLVDDGRPIYPKRLDSFLIEFNYVNENV